jgi:dihydroxyacetone kinase-like protein
MLLDPIRQRHVIELVARRTISATDELTGLDQAIGDGDHGLNMKRGFEAVLTDLDKIAGQPLPQALAAVGTTLVMTVGGASGPLYGTLFMSMGKAMPAKNGSEEFSEEFIQAFATSIEAVKARGKSQEGQKTMLDVLVPVQRALASGERNGNTLRKIASRAAAATIPMQAKRGRASFLGERSVGHMDPGARSSEIIICAVLDAAEGKA